MRLPVAGSGACLKVLIDRGLGPLLQSRDPFDIRGLWELIGSIPLVRQRWDRFIAISAIDIALYDLKGKTLAFPSTDLLGGKLVSRFRAVASIILDMVTSTRPPANSQPTWDGATPRSKAAGASTERFAKRETRSQFGPLGSARRW